MDEIGELWTGLLRTGGMADQIYAVDEDTILINIADGKYMDEVRLSTPFNFCARDVGACSPPTRRAMRVRGWVELIRICCAALHALRRGWLARQRAAGLGLAGWGLNPRCTRIWRLVQLECDRARV